MKIVDLVQGTPEWHAHRAAHFNASDAAAMLGVSPHQSRRALLDEVHGGLKKEFSDYVQKRVIDPGHRFEARARILAEKIVGEELYPCVGVEGRLSASFDGVTLLGETGFEHKSLNDELRALMVDGCIGADLPEYHRIQMEQQCLVSGAERVLFMASEWEGDRLVEERHCWYTPDPALRQRIVNGWKQFEADLAAYTPEPAAAPAPVGRAPDTLPALRIELTGAVTASNLAEFRDHAIAVFRGIRTDLRTDQDFADAEQTVKWCEDIESRLSAAKDYALSQTASIDALFRAIDSISAEARTKRLALDRLVTSRKQQIRADIVAQGQTSLAEHYRTINASLGEHAIRVPNTLLTELAHAVKGKRSVMSQTDAVDAVIVAKKIAASQLAEQIRANVAALAEASAGYEMLFPDRVALCATKTTEDLRNLVATRIAEHKQKEEAKRAEQERVNAAKPSALASQQASLGDNASAAAEPPPLAPPPSAAIPLKKVGAAPTPTGVRKPVKLGDINALIAPLSITSDGLSTLGFQPIGTERAAKLYAAADVPAICTVLARRLTDAGACHDQSCSPIAQRQSASGTVAPNRAGRWRA